MKLTTQNVTTPLLNNQQTELRFELFEWLKTKELSAGQSAELLELTAAQIRKAALMEKI